MEDAMIGVDLAKNALQLHGAAMTGEVRFRKQLSRLQFMKFMTEHPAAVVVMEACGSASYWARVPARAGHEVKLIAPQYVKPWSCPTGWCMSAGPRRGSVSIRRPRRTA